MDHRLDIKYGYNFLQFSGSLSWNGHVGQSTFFRDLHKLVSKRLDASKIETILHE
jgi:hypothetical protein